MSEPWQYLTATLGNGDPVVVVRGDDGVLRAFYNVCAHHAARVVTAPDEHGDVAESKCLRCPYHGWQYRLDGKLSKAAKIKGISGFRPRDNGLRPLAVEEFGAFVFVRPLSPEQQAAAVARERRPSRRSGAPADGDTGAAAEPVMPLATQWASLKERLDEYGFARDDFEHVRRTRYALNCDFKVRVRACVFTLVRVHAVG